jgi:hypothetical protein
MRQNARSSRINVPTQIWAIFPQCGAEKKKKSAKKKEKRAAGAPVRQGRLGDAQPA